MMLTSDKNNQTLIAEILALTQSPDVSTPQAILHGLDKLYYLSVSQAYSILSRNEQGEFVKKNTSGNSVAIKIGKVFFKYFSKGKECPLIEQGVYQLNRLLGGEIVTPSCLLVLELPDVAMLPEGKIFGLQASLAVEGVELEAILHLPSSIIALKRLLGEEKLIAELEDLLAGTYYQNWLKAKPQVFKGMPWDEKVFFLCKEIFASPIKEQPREFQESSADKDKRTLIESLLKKRDVFIMPALALAEHYPELRGALNLEEIGHIAEVFPILRRLYPNATVAEMVVKAENIMSCFNLDNLSYHFVLSLLTRPCDHKGDNFIVEICHDESRELLPLKLVAIDNNQAMGCALYKDKDDGHRVAIKTLIYSWPRLLSLPIAQALVKRILTMQPEVMILEWLMCLYDYQKNYQTLFENKILNLAEFQQRFHLDEHVPVGFIEQVLQKLRKLQEILTIEQSAQQETLLLAVEPVIGPYYLRVTSRFSDMVLLQKQLYQARWDVSLEHILQEDMSKIAPGELALLAAELKYKSYDSAIKDLIRLKEDDLLSAQSFWQKETLNLLMYLVIKRGFILEIAKLSLSPRVFAELYVGQGMDFIQFILKIPAVFIRLNGEGPKGRQIAIKSERILYEVMGALECYDFLDEIIEGLIDYGASIDVPYNSRGFTLLHFAAEQGLQTVIVPLLRKGVKLDAHTRDNQTALDIAMQKGHEAVVLRLMACGVKVFSLKQGLELLKRYWDNQRGQCQVLLQANPALAWQFTLKEVAQEAMPRKYLPVHIRGISESGQRLSGWLKESAFKQIYDKDGNPIKRNKDGRHTVSFWQVDSDVGVGMYLKFNPEFPSRELMVHYLAKGLFEFITPQVMLWNFSKAKANNKLDKPVVVLATRKIAGDNLQECLNKYPKRLGEIDKESFAQAAILAILINPEDGKWDNYILEPFYCGRELKYRIISIDNDRAFVEPLKTDKDGVPIPGPQGLLVKTVLFCFDAMAEKIPDSVRQRLLAIEPYTFLQAWLGELKVVQGHINDTFDRREISRACHIDILFHPSIVVNIYHKLVQIKRILAKPKNQNISLLQLLCQIIPELGLRYSKSFKDPDATVQERFEALTKGCFLEKILDDGHSHSMTMSSPSQVMQMTMDRRKELLMLDKKREEKDISPDAALAVLKSAHEEIHHLPIIRDELQKGRAENLMLLSPLHQEWVVNGKAGLLDGIDFSAMAVKTQDKVLTILQRIKFRCLSLRNSAQLNDMMLIRILRTSKESLASLELVGCRRITTQGIRQVLRLCQGLEKLKIQGHDLLQVIDLKEEDAKPGLSSVNSAIATSLRKLYVDECLRLKSIDVSAFNLEQTSVINCPIYNGLNLVAEQAQERAIKIVLISADTYAGKTTLIHRFIHDVDPSLAEIPPAERDYYFNRVRMAENRIDLWDTSGYLRYRTISRSYLRDVHVIIVCLPVKRMEGRRLDLEDLLPYPILDYDEYRSRMLLVGTMADCNDECRAFTEEEGKAFAREHDLLGYLECSAKTGKGVDEVFRTAALSVLDSESKAIIKEFHSQAITNMWYCGTHVDILAKVFGCPSGQIITGTGEFRTFTVNRGMRKHNLQCWFMTDVATDRYSMFLPDLNLIVFQFFFNEKELNLPSETRMKALSDLIDSSSTSKKIKKILIGFGNNCLDTKEALKELLNWAEKAHFYDYLFCGDWAMTDRGQRYLREYFIAQAIGHVHWLAKIDENFPLARQFSREIESVIFPHKDGQGMKKAITKSKSFVSTTDAEQSTIATVSTPLHAMAPSMLQQSELLTSPLAYLKAANTNYQYEDYDMTAILGARLEEEITEPGQLGDDGRIQVLAAVDGLSPGVLEKQLADNRRKHSGARVTLIPYNVGHYHWIGILLEFNAENLITRALHIDSLGNSDLEVLRNRLDRAGYQYQEGVALEPIERAMERERAGNRQALTSEAEDASCGRVIGKDSTGARQGLTVVGLVAANDTVASSKAVLARDGPNVSRDGATSGALLTQTDGTSCGAYAIENLILAVTNQRPPIPTPSAKDIRDKHLDCLERLRPNFCRGERGFYQRQFHNRITALNTYFAAGNVSTIVFSAFELRKIFDVAQCIEKFANVVVREQLWQAMLLKKS